MSRPLILGAVLTCGFFAMALLSLVWTPYDHTLLDIPQKLQAPHAAHVLGTDHLGRDMLSMVMVGTRTSVVSHRSKKSFSSSKLLKRRAFSAFRLTYFTPDSTFPL